MFQSSMLWVSKLFKKNRYGSKLDGSAFYRQHKSMNLVVFSKMSSWKIHENPSFIDDFPSQKKP